MNIIQKYSAYLPILIGAAAFFVLALVFWLASRRALKNSMGGTNWVSEYRTSGFDFTHERLTKQRHDWLCLFGVVVFTLIFSAAVCVMRSNFEAGSWMQRFFRVKTACSLVIYAAGSFCVCWLLMDMLRDNTLAVCGGILSALSFVGSHTAMSLAMISLLLLLRWFVTDDDAPMFPNLLLLLASDVLLALAVSRLNGLLWLLLGYLAVYLIKGLRRAGERKGKRWELVVIPIICAVLFAVSFYAAKIAGLVAAGAVRLSKIGDVLPPVTMLRLIRRLFLSPLASAVAPLQRSLLLYPLLDAPILMLGIFGVLVCVRTASDRHEPAALASVLLMAALTLAWLLGRQYCLLPGLLLCSMCLLRRFTAADRKAPVVVYTVLSAAYYLAIYVLTYLLNGPVAIAQIIA